MSLNVSPYVYRLKFDIALMHWHTTSCLSFNYSLKSSQNITSFWKLSLCLFMHTNRGACQHVQSCAWCQILQLLTPQLRGFWTARRHACAFHKTYEGGKQKCYTARANSENGSYFISYSSYHSLLSGAQCCNSYI